MTREQSALWWWWAAVLAAVLVLVYELSGVMLPFAVGMAAAYFLDPMADQLERRKLSRTSATLVITLIFFAVIAGLALLVIPVIDAQVVEFAEHVPVYEQAVERSLGPLVRKLMAHLSRGDIDHLRAAVGEHAGTIASYALDVVGGVLRHGLALIDLLSLLFVTPIVTFYMLRDWDRLVAQVDSWLPRAHVRAIRTACGEIDQTLAAYVRGQALVCVILAGYYGLALTIAGVDLGLVIGAAAGLLSFVPYLGVLSGLVAAMGMAYAGTGDWHLPATAAAIFAAGHLMESNFLTPRLVGDRIGLHPLWVLFALLAGGELVGMLGIVLAVPVAAIIGVVVRHALARYLTSPLYGDTL